jgi:hypothetical protein
MPHSPHNENDQTRDAGQAITRKMNRNNYITTCYAMLSTTFKILDKTLARYKTGRGKKDDGVLSTEQTQEKGRKK